MIFFLNESGKKITPVPPSVKSAETAELRLSCVSLVIFCDHYAATASSATEAVTPSMGVSGNRFLRDALLRFTVWLPLRPRSRLSHVCVYLATGA